MSENNEMVLALIEMLLNSKGHPGCAAVAQAAPEAPVKYGAPEKAGAPMPAAAPERPRFSLCWEGGQKAAAPGKYSPIGAQQGTAPPPGKWAANGRFGQPFSYPQYSRRRKDQHDAYPMHGLRGAQIGQRCFGGMHAPPICPGLADQPWPWLR